MVFMTRIRHIERFAADLRAAAAAGDAVALLEVCTAWLRKGGAARALVYFRELYRLLAADTELAAAVGGLLCRWLSVVRVYPTLITSGIFSRQGFSREFRQRFYERINPAYKDRHTLRDVLGLLFCRSSDAEWLAAVPLREWLRLAALLRRHTDPAQLAACRRQLAHENLYAVEMLSIWIAAEELDPDLIRLEPKLLDVESPLVGLQRETALWLEHRRNGSGETFDDAHLKVMLAQSYALVERLRRKGTGAGAGSSLTVAHLLERLKQTLKRLETLMGLADTPKEKRLGRSLLLCRDIVMATVEQRAIRPLWRGSVKMLARSISQNSSRHGEHYITRNRSEYFAMLRSASGGGLLIALMALFKIYLGGVIHDPFHRAVAESLNYGLGFVLIHMLHFTVATKQPAMTAASFAQAVERSDKGRSVDTKLAQLLIEVFRSQSVAVFGNMFVAVSLAMLLAWGYLKSHGVPLLDAAVSSYQLKSLNIFGPTLWFAAIAGVWLFCSGIIAGFFDNRADYLNLKMRLREHPLLKRLLPQGVRGRFAEYVHHHYGAIAGNFCFGVLLGMTGYIGHLTGLPLDIRHVAFSSANLGYAAASVGMPWPAFAVFLIFALMVGLVNLAVSFSITLWVALRSRDTRLSSPGNVVKILFQLLRQNPAQLFFPPPDNGDAKKSGEGGKH